MKTILKQAIAQSVRENFQAYPKNYPLNDGDVSEDAACNLISRTIDEYNNCEEDEKGGFDEWLYICINEYVDYFNLDGQSVREYFAYLLR